MRQTTILGQLTGQLKSTLLPFLVFLLTAAPALGQVNAGDLVRSGIDNAHKLLEAYGAPINKGFSAGLNAGWLNSGQVFEPGRFEVRLFGSAAFVPQKDQTFDVTQIGLSAHVRPANPANKIAPTLFGENQQGLPLEVYGTRPDTGEEVKLAAFNSAPGIGFQVAPLPMIQANIGLARKTELMGRYFPEIRFSDNRVDWWGLGLKHDIGQWLPLRLPFEVTAAAAYTAFQASDGLKVRPEANVSNPNPGDYSTQRIAFDTQAWQASLVASKTFFKRLNTYAGLSYSKGVTETALAGTYPVTVIRQQAPFNKEIRNFTDPVTLHFDHGQMGLTGGLRLKFSVFSFNLEGTWSQYSTVSAGMGLGWN
jgi:hypothetical protein